MKAHSALPFAAFLLLAVPCVSSAQPPKPPSAASSAATAGNPVEQVLDKLSEGMRKDLIQSLAAYPDDVLEMVFAASQHPENLMMMKPSETDKEFNAAASTLYTQYPGVFKALRQNPMCTAAVGQYARRYPTETWQQVDQARAANKMMPADLQAAAAKMPAVQMPKVAAPAGQGNGAGPAKQLTQVSESLDSTTKQLSGINKNLEELNSEADSAKKEYKRAKNEYNNVKSEALGTKSRIQEAAPVAALKAGTDSGNKKGGDASPFGAVALMGAGGGKGFGRTGAAASSPAAWQSSAMSGPAFLQHMQKSDGLMMTNFGKTEKAFGPQAMGPGAMKLGPGGPGGPGPGPGGPR